MTRARHAGFTLIELLIALAIAVILLLLALPGFTNWLADTNVNSGASSIADGLRFAQASAIKSNSNVEFTLTPATGWTVQPPGGAAIKVGVFAEGSKYATVDPVPASSTTVTFNYLGQVEAANATAPTAPVTQVNVTSTATTRQMRVLVGDSITGIKICNPAFAFSTAHPEGCP